MQTTISKLFKRSALCMHSHSFTVTLDFFVSTLGRFSVMNFVVFQSHIIISFFSKCEQVDAIYLDFSKAFDRVRHPHLLSLQALVLCWSVCRQGYKLLWGLPHLHPERPWQRLVFRRVLILVHSHSTCSSTIYLRHQSDPLKLFADDIQPPLDKWLLQPPGWSDGNGKVVLWWLLVFCWTHQNVLSSLSTAHFLLRTLTQLRVGWTWLNCKPDNQVLDYPTAVSLKLISHFKPLYMSNVIFFYNV